jgi:DNA-binding SARP family transcriptional activator/Tfp pilus assembly protein PilF
MNFGVLGELVVVADSGPITIGSAKSRTALAQLVLRRGLVVPMAEIADALWGQAAPSNARKSTHVAVNRLRKALGPLGELVRTRPDGYLLDVPADSTDVGRFASWLAAASNARDKSAGDELAALGLALDQWRGDALSDVPSELLDGERSRLTEQRLIAIERQHDLLMSAGRPADIAMLQDLCDRNPLREGIWFQLVRGLSESGRRSEALSAFDRLRRHLVAELGVEPGARLRELHARVLADERSTRGERLLGVIAPRPAPVVPRQVPHVAGFVGREQEQERLDALVPGRAGTGSSDTAVAVISGQPGVGKTALTARWARRTADRFVDGQIWLDLRGSRPGAVMPPDEALQHLLVSLGQRPSEIPGTVQERAARYQTLTDGRRLLVVLDDAANSEQVRSLLPGSPGSMVVVTSRYRLDGLVVYEAATGVELDVLPAPDARRFLMGRFGAVASGDETALLDEIAGHCGRLPLALALVAARAARRRQIDLGAVAAQLRSGRPKLDQFTVGDDAANLRTVYSWSYESLSAPAARLFRLLGLHPTASLSIEAAASLAGLSMEQTSRRVSELESAHLVTVPGGARIELHDLLHVYAGELGTGLDNRQAIRRVLDHYGRTVRTAVEHLGVTPATMAGASGGPRDIRGVTVPAIGSGSETQRWFVTEHANLVAVVQLAGDLRHDAECVRIGVLATELQEWNGQWGEVTRTQAIVLAAALRVGMPDVAARAEFHLGKAAQRTGQHERARRHFLRAEVRNSELGHAGCAEVYLGLGAVAESQGRWSKALEHDRKALEHVRATGDRGGEARALNAIGWDLAHLGDLDMAVTWCEEALRLANQIDDPRAVAAAWDSLGYCRAQAADLRGALHAYQRAVETRNEIGYHNGIAKGYRAMGDLHAQLGDRTAAQRAWQASLEILDRSAPLAADVERERLAHDYGFADLSPGSGGTIASDRATS